jgi:hypothetical protein
MSPSPRARGLAAGVIVAACLVAHPVGPASAAGSASAAKRCDKLQGRNLVKGGLIKVVDRAYTRPNGRRGHRYVACARQGGPQRRLVASSAGGRLELLDNRGAMLAVRDVASGSVQLWNLAKGSRRRLLSSNRNPVGAVTVTESGEAAALFRRGRGTTLVGFDYDGTAYTLDTGAISRTSLRHGKQSMIGWTSAGVTRTTDLTEPRVACASLKGKRVLRTDTLNVVSFDYASEYLEGDVNGRSTRVRACVLPDGPVRTLGESISATDGVQGGGSFEVVGGAGTFVLERYATSDSQGDFTPDRLTVHDLRSGRRVSIWGNADAEGPNAHLGAPLPPGPLLTSTGQAGAVFADDAGNTERVVGFDVAGTPHILDAAPSAEIDEKSLAVDGAVVSWTHGGETRTADLTGL